MSLADAAAAKILSKDFARSAITLEKPGIYHVDIPKHISIIWVDGCGGGGGGGGGLTGGGAGAGGGGAMACKFFPITLPPECQSLHVVIGAGGNGGIGGPAPTTGTAGAATFIQCNSAISTYGVSTFLLNLLGGQNPSSNPTTTTGGQANTANFSWAWGTNAQTAGNIAGNSGQPAAYNNQNIQPTNNVYSGGSGGNGGGWNGTGTGGNGGSGGIPFLGAGGIAGGAGNTYGAGGGGGGVSWPISMGMAGGGGIGGPAGITPGAGTEPSIPGAGGNGGATGANGSAGADGFLRILW